MFTFRSPTSFPFGLEPLTCSPVATTLQQADTAYNYTDPGRGSRRWVRKCFFTPGKWNRKISKSSRVAEAPWESL